MLDAGASVGDFGEVVAAQFFLFFETEWAVVGRDYLQVILLQSVPEFFLVPLLAQWGRENVFRSFESGYVEILDGKIEILRTSLGIHGKASIAGFANFFEGVVTA